MFDDVSFDLLTPNISSIKLNVNVFPVNGFQSPGILNSSAGILALKTKLDTPRPKECVKNNEGYNPIVLRQSFNLF